MSGYIYPKVKNAPIVDTKSAIRVILPFLDLASRTGRHFDDDVWAACNSSRREGEYKITYGELNKIIKIFNKVIGKKSHER
jgi:hypothetical protein